MCFGGQKSFFINARFLCLHIARSFTDLAGKISLPRTGFTSLNMLLNAISQFYDPDSEAKYGIVGIELDIL